MSNDSAVVFAFALMMALGSVLVVPELIATACVSTYDPIGAGWLRKTANAACRWSGITTVYRGL